jgi:hypothetical protein
MLSYFQLKSQNKNLVVFMLALYSVLLLLVLFVMSCLDTVKGMRGHQCAKWPYLCLDRLRHNILKNYL